MWKTIQKSATKLTNIPYNLAGSHNNTFTRVACRVPLKLANDGSGKHTHVAEQTCILDNCENKICEKFWEISDQEIKKIIFIWFAT